MVPASRGNILSALLFAISSCSQGTQAAELPESVEIGIAASGGCEREVAPEHHAAQRRQALKSLVEPEIVVKPYQHPLDFLRAARWPLLEEWQSRKARDTFRNRRQSAAGM